MSVSCVCASDNTTATVIGDASHVTVDTGNTTIAVDTADNHITVDAADSHVTVDAENTTTGTYDDLNNDIQSIAPNSRFVGYISSKHAIAGLTKSMAFELGPEIRCNGIASGAIHTAMVDSIGGVEALQMMVDGAPMKRVGQGEDIAALALFLASDESEFVDGQIIRCDGGFEC